MAQRQGVAADADTVAALQPPPMRGRRLRVSAAERQGVAARTLGGAAHSIHARLPQAVIVLFGAPPRVAAGLVIRWRAGCAAWPAPSCLCRACLPCVRRAHSMISVTPVLRIRGTLGHAAGVAGSARTPSSMAAAQPDRLAGFRRGDPPQSIASINSWSRCSRPGVRWHGRGQAHSGRQQRACHCS